LGLAEAAEGDTRVWIDDWALTHRGDAYETKIAADGFSLVLKLQETQPIMLNGDAGLSRKGPEAGAARPGSITNGRANISTRRPPAGIGSVSTSMMAER
jgi:predicted secreted hydrolase